MKKRPLVVLALAGVVCLSRAEATLGEPASSVDRDATELSATRRAATAHRGYTVETLQADGVTIRELVTTSGVVFALAWEGAAPPDLDALLGSHAGAYRSALDRSRPRKGRRGHTVETPQAVVETWGHMRHLRGRAYLPALVPEGVTVDDLR